MDVFDHDFPSLAEGIIIPYGIYDLKKNQGYISIGTSHDTSEFACDSIKNWWNSIGKGSYPQAKSILILCDGGGSNGSRFYVFKLKLQELANEIGIEIRIGHYPPYSSKYNPIEHKMFPHITRALQGVIFSSLERVKGLIEKTRTKKGLFVRVDIIDKVYQTGKEVAKEFKENMPIVFDEYLPQWNYRAIPMQN